MFVALKMSGLALLEVVVVAAPPLHADRQATSNEVY